MTTCTPDHHALLSLDATSCQCGAVLVTDDGLRLASDPSVELRIVKSPSLATPPGVTSREWTFSAADLKR